MHENNTGRNKWENNKTQHNQSIKMMKKKSILPHNFPPWSLSSFPTMTDEDEDPTGPGGVGCWSGGSALSRLANSEPGALADPPPTEEPAPVPPPGCACCCCCCCPGIWLTGPPGGNGLLFTKSFESIPPRLFIPPNEEYGWPIGWWPGGGPPIGPGPPGPMGGIMKPGCGWNPGCPSLFCIGGSGCCGGKCICMMAGSFGTGLLLMTRMSLMSDPRNRM